MKHLRRVSALFVLLTALVVIPARPAKAIAPAAADFLNPDGTLRMEALEDGTLDLRGWDVNFDSRRGPVFRPLALNGTWSTHGGGLNGDVTAIAVSGSNVYVGGWFTQAGGISANRIAVWNGTTWSALGSGLNNVVTAIAISGSNVYVGGWFTQAGGISANYIACWDGTTWSALGSGLNNNVYAVAVSGSNVYVGGGVFTSAGGVPANRVAVWDSTTSTWSALGNGVDNFVYAITISGPNVYFGGQFTQAGGVSANHIASFLADTAPPTVIFRAGSVPPFNGANLTVGPSQLVVHFSENVLSNGSQHAANSLWNYMLLSPGPNGIFDTPISTLPPGIDPICDSDHVREGDDERIDLLNATYNAANFAATITIDPFFAPLANGTYRLYVCGAASVDDLAGNQLNGGANTAVNFTVGAGAVVPAAQANSGKRRSTLPSTGFAPNQVTILPPQTISYSELGDLWLEVPKLGLKIPIVGVPKTNDQWDVSWLGSSAGWLEGSAYPSWNGNSVLTGHVWNADNTPGPFVDLNKLWWGDKVIVHVSGQQYVYEIRSVKQIAPTDVEAMMKHEELPWLTLVSCKGYDEKAGAYRYRILVRAVLVEVK